jgi:ribosomal protein L20A (L18A)
LLTLKEVVRQRVMKQGVLTPKERSELASKHKVSYKKIYKIEWDFKNGSQMFSEVIRGYPDEEAMGRILSKFRQRKEAQRRYKPLIIFRTERN